MTNREQAIKRVAEVRGGWTRLNGLNDYAVDITEKLLELAQSVIEEYSPCRYDDGRPSWCMTHLTRNCTAGATYNKAQAALQPKRE